MKAWRQRKTQQDFLATLPAPVAARLHGKRIGGIFKASMTQIKASPSFLVLGLILAFQARQQDHQGLG